MNASPPLRASATPMVSSDTDCIIADAIGTFRCRSGGAGGR